MAPRPASVQTVDSSSASDRYRKTSRQTALRFICAEIDEEPENLAARTSNRRPEPNGDGASLITAGLHLSDRPDENLRGAPQKTIDRRRKPSAVAENHRPSQKTIGRRRKPSAVAENGRPVQKTIDRRKKPLALQFFTLLGAENRCSAQKTAARRRNPLRVVENRCAAYTAVARPRRRLTVRYRDGSNKKIGDRARSRPLEEEYDDDRD